MNSLLFLAKPMVYYLLLESTYYYFMIQQNEKSTQNNMSMSIMICFVCLKFVAECVKLLSGETGP